MERKLCSKLAVANYCASAPGTLMLLGEHAVLRHNTAIVCAIDKRITVTLYPQDNSQVVIRSGQVFKEFVTTINDLNIQEPYSYVLAALLSFQTQLKSGLIVVINSEFSAKVGFGSSAAVTVAMVATLAQWLELAFTKQDVFNKAKQVMLSVQGVGSGADLAASVHGGVIYYVREPFTVEALPIIENLTAIYSGAKLATKEVLAIVAKQEQLYPNIYAHIFLGLDACVRQGVVALKRQDWLMLGRVFSMAQGFMVALGVSSALLDSLVWQLKDLGAMGAKISGSGLGDCVIGLGEIRDGCFPANDWQRTQGVQQLPIKVSAVGLRYE